VRPQVLCAQGDELSESQQLALRLFARLGKEIFVDAPHDHSLDGGHFGRLSISVFRESALHPTASTSAWLQMKVAMSLPRVS